MSGTLFGNAPQMTIGGMSFPNPSYVAPVAAQTGTAAQAMSPQNAPSPGSMAHTGQGSGGYQNGPIGSISGANPLSNSLGNLFGAGGGPGGQMIGGGNALGLASMLPGIPGLAAGAVNMARKGYNLSTEDAQGQAAGYPPMTFAQAAGGMLPLIGNGYGSGAAGQAAYDQAQQAKLGMQPTQGSSITADPVDRTSTPAGAYGGSDAAGGNGATGDGPGTGGYGGLGNPTGGGQGVTGGEQGFAKGGIVTPDRLQGRAAPPDVGYGALQPGEMVVQRGATSQFAPLLQAINNPTPQNLALIGGGDPRKGAMMLQALMAQMHGGQPPRPPAGPPGMPPGMPPGPPGAPPGGMPPGAPQQPQGPLPSPNAAIPQAGPAQPPKPPLAPPPGAPGVPPGAQQNLARFGQAAQRPMTPQQMGAAGRFGDTMVAHLTPGEVEIPPQVQTPQLMQAIAAAFQKAGVSPAQFTAGSPQSSHNPATGAPEYNFLSAILPSALGLLGSAVVGPEVLGPMLGLGAGAASAIGGGLGGALGSALGGGNGEQDIVSGLGGAIGGYAGNGMGGASPQQSGTLYGSQTQAGPTAVGDPSSGGSSVPTTATSPTQPFGSGINWRGGLGAALGAGIGNAITPKTPTAASQLPPGFTNNITPVNPNFNALFGNGRPSTPSFAGYNPYAAVTGPGYTFY